LSELEGKGKIGGDVDALLRSHDIGGEERRGWWGSGAGGVTWRKEKGKPRLGRATRMEDDVGVGGTGSQHRWAPVSDV
jgi:hypothetical protein